MTRSRLEILWLALIGAAILLAAIGLPVALTALHPRIVAHSYPDYYLPFELMGFTAAAALLALGALCLATFRPLTLERALPVIAALLVGFYALGIVSEYSNKSWDYRCYEDAARSILRGENPYGRGYLYPPLTAEALAGVSVALRAAMSALPSHGRQDDTAIWYLVFYFYQWMQWLLVIAAWLLCYRLARQVGFASRAAALLVAALFVVDNPLLRTLRHTQLNLWILDLSLAAILMLRRSPWVSGVLVAFGGHLKLYPLVLLAPWAVSGRWRAVAGAVLGLMGIALLQTRLGTDWTLWRQFVESSGSFPKSEFFRDNSLRGVISNTLRLFGGDGPSIEAMTKIVVLIAIAAVAVWFLVRFLARERADRAALLTAGNDAGTREAIERARDLAHSMDALAFTLLASPVVWEHVYVLAVPIVIWAAGTHGRERPWPIAIGAFLMLAVPTFDLFPLSYHRLVGLLIVLGVTSGVGPRRVAEEPAPAAGPAPAGALASR